MLTRSSQGYVYEEVLVKRYLWGGACEEMLTKRACEEMLARRCL
jgi:hypothetical protein